MKEHDIQRLIQLEASARGARLWRNNVGATYTSDGRFLRFGLANESEQMNKIIKSSDLIGIKPIIITQEMVGKKIGQFICREVKKEDWKFNGKNERDIAQWNWIELIKNLGGDAEFTNRVGSIS